MNNKALVASALLIGFSSVFVACRPQPASDIQPAQASADSFKTQGEYEMHYNALRTDQLTPEVARAYGIERSKNRVLLNVSVLHRASGASGSTATDADIAVTAHNLNGQTKDLALRRVTEGTAIYYIGDVSISGDETLVFEIKATPAGTNTALEATLTRQFFAG